MFRAKIKDNKEVYCDHAATTPPFAAVEDAVRDFFTNYGSVHRGAGRKSQVSTDRYEDARRYILESVNAPDSYLIYTGNTTGAMNCAAEMFSRIYGDVAVSTLEHSSSLLPWICAEGRVGKTWSDVLNYASERVQEKGRSHIVRYDLAFDGTISGFEECFRNREIKAVVLTASSNISGACPDIKYVSEITHRHGAYLVVDACQYIQHHPVDMQADGIDFLAASGHKFYAPYGGGFLVGPKKFLDEMLPYQIGGGNLPYITNDGEFIRYRTQQAHDPGTPNAVGAIAMAEALRVIREDIGYERIAENERSLYEAFYAQFSGSENIRFFNFPSVTVPFDIPGLHHREVGRKLSEDYGIGIRTGNFCVYRAINDLLGITDDTDIAEAVRNGDTSRIPGICRISFGLTNTDEQAEYVGRCLKKIAE